MATEQYREVSYIRRNGEPRESLTADTTLVFHGRKAYRRIRSKFVRGYYTDVPCDGDPVEYERQLLHEKRVMADFDERQRLGAVPKPPRQEISEACDGCGGDGEYEDKHGNWKTCPKCGGEG